MNERRRSEWEFAEEGGVRVHYPIFILIFILGHGGSDFSFYMNLS